MSTQDPVQPNLGRILIVIWDFNSNKDNTKTNPVSSHYHAFFSKANQWRVCATRCLHRQINYQTVFLFKYNNIKN
jgi:hypothetical protein